MSINDPSGPSTVQPDAVEQQTRQWAMFLHLSLFAGCIIPFAGFVAPIVIWQMKKAEFPLIDAHGKNAANFIISLVIYGAACFILAFIGIGILLYIALLAIAIIFPIIAAIKGNNGEVWKYPLAIQFLK